MNPDNMSPSVWDEYAKKYEEEEEEEEEEDFCL